MQRVINFSGGKTSAFMTIKEYREGIGFRADEPQRVFRHKERWKGVTTLFPLYNKGINKQMINTFWATKPYTLEIPAILGNCTLCFMKGKDAIMAILASYPELADPWIKDEEAAKDFFGHTYIQNTTITQLRDMAQNNLFKDYELTNINPALYHDDENNFILCRLCEDTWTNRDKTKMAIYQKSEEVAEILKLKYYKTKNNRSCQKQ